MVNESPVDERDQRRIGDEAGAVDDRVEGTELLVESFDLPFGVRSVGKVAFLKRNPRAVLCGDPLIESTDGPAVPQKFIGEVPSDLAGDSCDENRAIRQ